MLVVFVMIIVFTLVERLRVSTRWQPWRIRLRLHQHRFAELGGAEEPQSYRSPALLSLDDRALGEPAAGPSAPRAGLERREGAWRWNIGNAVSGTPVAATLAEIAERLARQSNTAVKRIDDLQSLERAAIYGTTVFVMDHNAWFVFTPGPERGGRGRWQQVKVV